jgi:uncharacterized protein with ACT and thioredoxin-like domain
MYDVTNGWGGSSPFGPCIVVTHRVAEQPEPASGFEFVRGVEAAIERAREIAGDKDIVIGGGASIAQQALRAGLVSISSALASASRLSPRTSTSVLAPLGERSQAQATTLLPRSQTDPLHAYYTGTAGW